MKTPPASPPTIHVRLHGTGQVQRAGGPALALERKQAAVLALLALDGPMPRSRIATLLWPEADEERSRANLRQRLAKLRALEAGLLRDDGRALALAPGVTVDTGAGALLSCFDYGDCEVFAQWLDGQRDTAQADHKAALLRQTRKAIEAGELANAQHTAEALLALDRESEDAHRLLMEALYLRGAYAEAITVWDRCRDMLRQLYGVPPSPPTQTLGELVLSAARSERAVPLQQRDAMPLSLLRPPQMIGRSRALDALLAGWYAGQVLCVCGSAGLGKSRLLAEFATAAGGGASVAARLGDALQPYTALGRLLLAALDHTAPAPDPELMREAARLVPALARFGSGVPEPLRTEYERTQALRAACRLLQDCTAHGCQTLVFDDLQFADIASIEALPILLAATDPPLRMAFGSRTGEEAPQGAVLLDALAAQGRLTRVELEPLGQPEVAALLASLSLPGIDTEALAPALRRRVGGNPAFLLESLKLLLSLGEDALMQPELLPLAPGIDAVVSRRIGLLTAQARHIAELAAVAGPAFSTALATEVLGLSMAELAPSLRELELRQVLYGRRFVHDLVGSAVLGATPPADAEQLHRRVAQVIDAPGTEPARAASHWRACGEWQSAARCYMAAAEGARKALRPVERSQFLDSAIECLERAGEEPALFDAIEARLKVSDAPDRIVRRVPLMDRLDTLAKTPEQELRALSHRVVWHADHARQDAFELGREGMQRALALGLPALAFGLASGVAWQLAMAGQAEAAVQTMEQHRAWVQTQPAGTRAEFHHMLSGVQGFSDRLLPAIASAEDALAILRNEGHSERALPLLSNVGLLRWWRGDLDAAKAALLEAQALRDRMHGGGASLFIDLNLGAVLRDRAEYLAAHEILTSVLRQFRETAQAEGPTGELTDVVMAENHLAEFWLRIGRPLDAQACLHSIGGVDVRFRARRAGLQLRIARWLGRAEPILLEEARAMARAMSSPFNRAWLELELARALPPAEAALEFARLIDCAPVRERPGMQLHAMLRAAQAAHESGQRAVARAHLAGALVLSESCQPFDIDRAEVWLTAGKLFAADGEPERARQQWERGAQWVLRIAEHHLPEPWRASFLHDHPTNRALLAAAAQ